MKIQKLIKILQNNYELYGDAEIEGLVLMNNSLRIISDDMNEIKNKEALKGIKTIMCEITSTTSLEDYKKLSENLNTYINWLKNSGNRPDFVLLVTDKTKGENIILDPFNTMDFEEIENFAKKVLPTNL